MNDFNEIVKRLLIFYGSTTVSSLLFNKIYYTDRIKKTFKKSKRKLIYKDLTLNNDRDLKRIREFCKIEKIVSILISICPILNIRFTAENIMRDKDKYDEFFNKQIDLINQNELKQRREFLEEIQYEREIPEDIMYKINNDKDYLPSEDDYLRTKKMKRKVKELPITNFVDPFIKDDKYWD